MQVHYVCTLTFTNSVITKLPAGLDSDSELECCFTCLPMYVREYLCMSVVLHEGKDADLKKDIKREGW